MLLAHAGHWFLWPLIPLFWFLLIAVFVIFVVRPPAGPVADGRRSGESVLSERYARGEIDEAEYRRRLTSCAKAATGERRRRHPRRRRPHRRPDQGVRRR